VCNRFDGAVQAIDLNTGRELGRVLIGREPVAAALTPDQRWLLVAHLLPEGRADARFVAAKISVIDTSNFAVRTQVRLVNGGVLARGVAVSPDGRWAVVTHNLARYQVPTTQVEHGWMNDAALSVIDLETFELTATVLLDEPPRGAANPWGVDWTADGRLIVVSHSGTHELSVIDAPAMLEKLSFRAKGGLINNLTFLDGIRRRIPVAAQGPRAMVLQGSTAWVAGFFSDSLAGVELHRGETTSMIRLPGSGPANLREQGERVFHDATIGHQHWQSCASCHPDGRVDGLNWDLLNDGIGNPKSTKSLLLSHQTPPSMSLGVRATAETAVRSGMRNILFARRNEEQAQAMDAFLKGLEPVPSPFLEDGGLSKAAQRGRRLFHDPMVGCAQCHPAPLYTDLRSYAVGTHNTSDRPADRFDTPTLIEAWRTAPYLHDGSAVTMIEVVTTRNPEDAHGRTSHLTPEDIEDLAAFVLSL
jgi:cytochrome c peroxidase